MRKCLIFIVAAALSCGLLSCNSESSPAEQSVSGIFNEDLWERAVEMELSGRCVKGTDGMLLFSGDGENQKVYILISDVSGNNLLRSIKDGDDVSIKGKVIKELFPYNVAIMDGTISSSDGKMTLNKTLVDGLVAGFMLDKSIYEHEKFEVAE